MGTVMTDSSMQIKYAEQSQKLRQTGVQKTQNDKGHSQDKNSLVEFFLHSGGAEESDVSQTGCQTRCQNGSRQFQ